MQPAGEGLGQLPRVARLAEPLRDRLGLALDGGPGGVGERLRELGHLGPGLRAQLGVVGQQDALGEPGDHVQRLGAGLVPALAEHERVQQLLELDDGQVIGGVVDPFGDRLGVPDAHQVGVVAELRERRSVRVGERQPLVVVEIGEHVGR